MNSNVFLNELSTVRQTSYTSRATRRDDERSTKSAVVVPGGSHVKENKAPVALISPAAVCGIIKARWDHVPLLWTTWFTSSAFTPRFPPLWGHCFVFWKCLFFFAHPSSAGTGSSRPVTRLWMSRYRRWMDGGWTMDWCVPAPPTEGRIVLNQKNQRLSLSRTGHTVSSHQSRVKPSSPVLMVRMGGLLLCYLEERVYRLCPTSQQGSDRTRTLKKLQDSITERVQTCEISFSQIPPCLFIP